MGIYITEYNGIEWDMNIHICTSIYYIHVYMYIYIISIIGVLFTYISLHIYIFIYNYTYIARGLTFAHLFPGIPCGTAIYSDVSARVFFASIDITCVSCHFCATPKLQCFEPLTETATNQKALKEPPK